MYEINITLTYVRTYILMPVLDQSSRMKLRTHHQIYPFKTPSCPISTHQDNEDGEDLPLATSCRSRGCYFTALNVVLVCVHVKKK